MLYMGNLLKALGDVCTELDANINTFEQIKIIGMVILKQGTLKMEFTLWSHILDGY